MAKIRQISKLRNLNLDVENRLASVMVNGQTTVFYYDAGGNRTLTIQPNGTKVYTPFPEFEETVPTSGATTQRASYYLAGQLIAVRVKSGASDVYYYAYADHLGNVSAWTNTSGALVSNSLARYEPFGDYRTTPATAVNPGISERGFTGHRMNNSGTYDLGLIYMNARYYLPEIGRFISADTIVPEPKDPQSYNRYSYALNSPINYTDPTGHAVCATWATKVLCGFWRNALDASFEAASLAVQGDLLVTDRVSPPPSDNDVTGWLAYQLIEAPNSEVFQTIQSTWQAGDVPGAAVMWARHVATGASWDFKTDLSDAGVPDSNDEIQLGRNHLNFQVVANIFYGYVGRSLGMGEGYLQLGAGIAQFENGLLHGLRNYYSYPAGWGDQEFDAWAIGFGFYLFELYGNDPSQLTGGSLSAAFNDYIQDYPIPGLE